MSTLNKFIIYKCDTCQRQSEVLINGHRPDPVRCNITYKCRGKLQRVGESSAKKFLFTPPVAGLQDYIPRGTVAVASPTLTVDPDISMATAGGSGMLTMALLKRNALPNSMHNFSVLDFSGNEFVIELDPDSVLLPSSLTVQLKLFKISPNLLQFKRYTYLSSGIVQLIQGADDSPEANNLRFGSSNKLRVFINGVELTASQYDRTVDDQITFTPAIVDTNNVVDIIVYNDLSATGDSELINLEFKVLSQAVTKDYAFLSACCWGDSEAVNSTKGVKYLLHCIDLSLLTQDTSYGVSVLEISNGSETRIIKPSEALFLLGKSPFSVQDKELFAYLSGDALMDGTTLLSFSQNLTTGVYELTTKQSATTQLARPLTPTVMIKHTGVTTVVSKVATQNIQHSYILGPS